MAETFEPPTFDASALRAELSELTRLSAGFGATLTRAFASAASGGRKLSDVLKSLVLSLSRQALSSALRSLGQAIGGMFGNFSGGSAPVTPFAKGGVIGGPVAFPLRGGLGLAGEAGAEAILPLARGSDGRLGVRAAGGGTQVVVNITTPDIEGFRASQSQVAAMMLRALERGQRNL
ncbi:MAG: phage tail tape measure protein [Parvibaculaceae bacterium]